jgi:RNA polymerase sigma-70 factor (ECF subfamily)
MPPDARDDTPDRDDPASPAGGMALAECLARLAAGDLEARSRILELTSARLRILAHRMLARFPNVRRWEDTDDVFQNAALRLHRALARPGGPPRCVMALAATELRRELLDLARRHAGPWSQAAHHATNVIRAAEGSAVGRHDEQAVVPDEGLERWSLFHEAIDGLPPALREVFDLVWYVGADQKTIAGLLGCSERTVKSRWRDARVAVRAALEAAPPA